MTKFKQSNILDFYAPTGGGSKIADFGSAFNVAAITTTASSTNGYIGSSPNGSFSALNNAAATATTPPFTNGNIGSFPNETFSALKNATTVEVLPSTNVNTGSPPNGSSSTGIGNNVSIGTIPTWLYWVGGALFLGGSIYLVRRHLKKKEEEKKKAK